MRRRAERLLQVPASLSYRRAMLHGLTPDTIAPPFGAYAHGVVVPAGRRLVVTSGQLGLAPDGSIPSDVGAQAAICFANIGAILAAAGGGPTDVVRLNAYVTRREDFAAYMAERDAWLAGSGHLPASTLMIVGGFTRAAFLVEVEALAALPA
jgi:enamine deaminase RidA (YjgF/YER057c/UK114 family)